MKLSNIQENLSKTELVQRLQQIMQDAARAAQGAHTPAGDEHSRAVQEQVAESHQAEHDPIREEAKGKREMGGRHGRRRSHSKERQDVSENTRTLREQGRFIDFTV